MKADKIGTNCLGSKVNKSPKRYKAIPIFKKLDAEIEKITKTEQLSIIMRRSR